MEHSGVFSPDQKQFLFTTSDPEYQQFTVQVVEWSDMGWSKPRKAHFSAQYSDHGTSFSRDGKRVFFASLRPAEGAADTSDWHLWTATRGSRGWGEANLVNLPGWGAHWQSHPVQAADGSLYFHQFSARNDRDFDLLRAVWEGDRYGKPAPLGPAINTPGVEISPYLSPDQSYLLFAAYDRPDGFGGGDLYLSRRGQDGEWSPAENLGPSINTAYEESNPTITPDGQFLIFSSSRPQGGETTGEGSLLHLYWVSTEALSRRG
ncbi:MAG: hypothetical protein K0U98_22715 [Deltaproteobacteria bacterium]|nr:hypothetical protein [Deltaproteobacteria bacterium]